jgi:tagatose 1,6-diphosphate aldolase
MFKSTKAPFRFLRPGRLVDGELELTLVRKQPADPAKGYVPCYHFEMRRTGQILAMGTIRLRIGPARQLRYIGHMGYDVKPRCRGKRYAARSCRLLLPLAKAHGLRAVWLCCDPPNVASQKSCTIAGARLVETIRVPPDHFLYKEGSRYLRRYRITLSAQTSAGAQ